MVVRISRDSWQESITSVLLIDGRGISGHFLKAPDNVFFFAFVCPMCIVFLSFSLLEIYHNFSPALLILPFPVLSPINGVGSLLVCLEGGKSFLHFGIYNSTCDDQGRKPRRKIAHCENSDRTVSKVLVFSDVDVLVLGSRSRIMSW